MEKTLRSASCRQRTPFNTGSSTSSSVRGQSPRRSCWSCSASPSWA